MPVLKINLHSAPLLLLELVLLITPVIRFSKWVTLHDQQRIAQIVLLCLFALGSLFVWRTRIFGVLAQIPRPAVWLWLTGLTLGMISVLNAGHVRFAALEWASLFLLTNSVLALAAQGRMQGEEFDRWALRISLLVAFFVVLKFLINYSLVLHAGMELEARKLFRGSFTNPRFFGQAATLLLPLLAYPLMTDGLRRGKKFALFGLLAAIWLLVIASGTRGTFLALAIAAAVLAAVSWRVARPWLQIQFVGFLLGLAAFVLLFVWLPDAAQHPGIGVENRLGHPTTLSKREVIWSLAWQQMLAHPWLGIGPMHLASIPNPVATHPHNALLQLGAEWGLPATLALIFPLAYGMWALLVRIHRVHNAHTPLFICLAASLVGGATQAMVDGVIVMPYTQTLLILIVGWTLGLHFRETAPATPRRISLTGQIAGAIPVVVAAGLLIWGVFPEVFQRAAITRELVDSSITVFNPRYWVHGWIP